MDSFVWILLTPIVIILSLWFVAIVRRSSQSSKIYELKTKSLQHPETALKPIEPSLAARPNPKNNSSEDLMRAAEEQLKNTHRYGIWRWVVQPYAEWPLTITHPYNWKLVGTLTWYYIPWANMKTGTSPLGASLSWVNTPFSIRDVPRGSLLRESVTQALTAFVQEYLRIDDSPEITLSDRFSGLRPYSRDSITEEISKNIHRLISQEKVEKFLQIYYSPDKNIKVRVFAEVPFEGTSIGEHVVSFLAESTICVEASTRGLRYLIFFFDKLPSCVCELHLIKFEDSNFNEFDYLMAAYFIQEFQVNSDMLKLEKFQESQESPTLAAGWHNLVQNSDTGTAVMARIDRMSGLEFEQFVGQLLKSRGFEVEVTKSSGDFGIDVVAQKQGVKIGIQVKRQIDKVSRNAISDAVAGKSYYHCDRAMVITNNYFHDSAIVLAHSTRCELIDRDMLQLWIAESH